MKKTTLLLLASLLYFTASSQVKFINKPWNEVLAMAKELNKPVFVDVYTLNCGPCKQMDKSVFTDSGLGRFMNDSMIAFKMDAGLKENKWVIDTYHINSVPTLLYFSPDGQMIYKSGFADVNGMKENAKAVFTLLAKPKSLSQWKTEYESNKTNPAFMYDYISMLSHSGLYTGQVIEEYLQLVPKQERYSKKNLELILQNARTLVERGVACDVLLNCGDTLVTRFPEDEANNIYDSGLLMFTMGLLESAAIDTNELRVDYAISIASHILSPYVKEPGYELQIRCAYYNDIRDCRRYASSAKEYITTYYIADKGLINSDTMLTVSAVNRYASNFFTLVNAPEDLNMALNWCDRCLQLSELNAMVKENFYYNILDTKANLLYKSGKTSESIACKEKALASVPVMDYMAAERQRIEEELALMRTGVKTWN